MKDIKVFKLNEYEWWATKGDLEDLINWYRENIDNSETFEEMLNEAEECDLDKDGMWWETTNKKDLEQLGDSDELISRDKVLEFGSLKRFGYNTICKYIPFREAIQYDLDFTEPYCIASTEY